MKSILNIAKHLMNDLGMVRSTAYRHIRNYMQSDIYKESKTLLHNQIKNQLFAVANQSFSKGYNRVFLETVDRIMAMFPSLREEVEVTNDITLSIKVVDKEDGPGSEKK